MAIIKNIKTNAIGRIIAPIAKTALLFGLATAENTLKAPLAAKAYWAIAFAIEIKNPTVRTFIFK